MGKRHYDITVHSSAGEQKSHLAIEEADGLLTGEHWTDQWSHPIGEGQMHEDGFSWTSEVTAPFDVPLKFSARCEDEVCSVITGEVDAGRLGAFHFTGKKV